VTRNLAGGRSHLNDHELGLKSDAAEGVCQPGRANKPTNKPTNPNHTMKTLLSALIAGLGLILAGQVMAQTFTTLYSFTAGSGSFPNVTNSDGANPGGPLILSGNTLYGTAFLGGSSAVGTVFAVNTDGTGFTNLHSFANSDGAHPTGGLILAGTVLYGAAGSGGSSGAGTVFAVSIDGAGLTNLHSFTAASYPAYTNSDGVLPQGGLILSGKTLYGTAKLGGSSGAGTVFAVNTDGAGFTNLHTFNNSDGLNPQAGLILSDNTLYGTTSQGGSSGAGTVFAVNTNGTGFTNLYNFTATSSSGSNSDGAHPFAGVISSDNTLYGTTYEGGNGGGTVFAVSIDGTGFTNLHNFAVSDGFFPATGLILSGNTLYGTASAGGSWGYGAVFAVKTDGAGFTNLHSFAISDGARPTGLVLSGNSLYGTAAGGGSSGNGTVFSLSFAPQLTILPSVANVVLTWPTNVAGFSYAGYTLQSAPAVTGPFTNLPGATNPCTNPITGAQQFFRLISY
jgi:uncharacterized repeat protein (TIGR03803 family)